MKPALSVILFTVLSGAGLGLLSLSALMVLFGVALIDRQETLIGTAVGLALTAAGLVSSTFHLANPKNAWRALSRVTSSWLSREAAFALLLFPVALVYLALLWFGALPLSGWGVRGAALATATLALATLFATGMIYAVLRTIPQWHTALVPMNYLLLGLASGVLLLSLIVVLSGGLVQALLSIAIILLLLAALGKAVYYFWISRISPGPSMNTAIGSTRAGVKLLDIGHSSATFNTKEFGFEVSGERRLALRLGVFVLLFAVPIGFGVITWNTGSALAAALMLLSASAGLVLERWLFFAEARHTVNLFHGRQINN